MKITAKFLVSGMVQGVGFRYFTYQEAHKFDLTGYVRNRYDDKVEGEVEGEEGMVTDFLKRLKIGPRFGHVTSVQVDWQEYTGQYQKFEIRY